MDLKELLANNLKRLRSEKGLSQMDLAESAGVSNKLISEIERGIVWPREESLLQIAKALKVSATALLFDDSQIVPRIESALKK